MHPGDKNATLKKHRKGCLTTPITRKAIIFTSLTASNTLNSRQSLDH
jgi:hypothetical protein